MANVFPKWANTLPIKLIIALTLVGTVVVLGVTYYFTPKYTRVGYAPTQPVPFSHALHAGQLEMDCRYCHTFVDRSEHSNVPGANVCMSCHSMVQTDSPQLAAGPRNLRDGRADPLGADPQDAGLRLLQPCGAREPRYQLRGMSRGDPKHGGGASRRAAFDGFLPRVSPESGAIHPAARRGLQLDWERPTDSESLAEMHSFVHDWSVNPPQSCSGCHR